MRLRELKKLVEQVVAGAGGFNPGAGVDRTAAFEAAAVAPHPDGVIMEPLDPTRWTRVSIQFILQPDVNYGSTCYVYVGSGPPDWIDEPEIAFASNSTSPEVTMPTGVGTTVEVLVPPGKVYYFGPSGQGFDFGDGRVGLDATGVVVQKLFERPL